MKKVLCFLLFAVLAFGAKAQTGDYGSYLGALDTLTNADTTTYEASVTGPKANVTFQVNVTKISGTVAGTIKVYGSVDGTNYGTTALTTVNLTDASVNHLIAYTTNSYKKYKIQIITSGTQSCSQRTYLLYRKL